MSARPEADEAAPTCVEGEVTTRRVQPLPPGDEPTRVVRPVAANGTPGETGAADPAVGRERTVSNTVAQLAEQVPRQASTPWNPQRVDYSRLGQLIPVVPLSSGAGASVVSAVLADALQTQGWTTVLADTAEPARSGLAAATTGEPMPAPGPSPHPQLRLEVRWRFLIRVTRLAPVAGVPVLPSVLPGPHGYVPDAVPRPQVVVADVSHDAWRAAGQVLAGPGQWVRGGWPPPLPVMVVRPTRPSAMQAEQVLARLASWATPGAAAPPAALVVIGARRWPRGVLEAAGPNLGALAATTTFLPSSREIARYGVTAELTPTRLRAAVRPLLARLLSGAAVAHQ